MKGENLKARQCYCACILKCYALQSAAQMESTGNNYAVSIGSSSDFGGGGKSPEVFHLLPPKNAKQAQQKESGQVVLDL